MRRPMPSGLSREEEWRMIAWSALAIAGIELLALAFLIIMVAINC